MKNYLGQDIRNVAVVGHAHSGKTTLIAALVAGGEDDGDPGAGGGWIRSDGV